MGATQSDTAGQCNLRVHTATTPWGFPYEYEQYECQFQDEYSCSLLQAGYFPAYIDKRGIPVYAAWEEGIYCMEQCHAATNDVYGWGTGWCLAKVTKCGTSGCEPCVKEHEDCWSAHEFEVPQVVIAKY